MKRIILGIIGILAIIIIIFLLQSAPIDPAAYTPPRPAELTGLLAPNNLLQKAKLLAQGKINGPEEVAVDSHGRVYAGTQDGKIMRLLPDGKLETFAETKGRPLGLQFDKNENLVVCDSYKGLLSIDLQGKIKILVSSANGVPFKFTDALDISREGVIYFTDASSKYGQDEYLYDLLESKPQGSFLGYYPATGQIKVLLKNLYFANGVALSQEEDFVLIKGPLSRSHREPYEFSWGHTLTFPTVSSTHTLVRWGGTKCLRPHSAGLTIPHHWLTGSSEIDPPLITTRWFSSNPSNSTSRWTPCPPGCLMHT